MVLIFSCVCNLPLTTRRQYDDAPVRIEMGIKDQGLDRPSQPPLGGESAGQWFQISCAKAPVLALAVKTSSWVNPPTSAKSFSRPASGRAEDQLVDRFGMISRSKFERQVKVGDGLGLILGTHRQSNSLHRQPANGETS